MCLWAATSLPLASQSFGLQQVLTSPFPTQLTAAEHGSRVARVFADSGAQNVWVLDKPDFVPCQVTDYVGDSGQPIASLRLSPDCKLVVFARGTELNAQGRSANPTGAVTQPRQQVWAADVTTTGSEPRLL